MRFKPKYKSRLWNSNYQLLTSISGVDYPEREERFEIVYDILNIKSNSRIRIKTQIDEIIPLPSVVSLLDFLYF